MKRGLGKMKIEIIDARKEDAPLIARVVAMGIGYEDAKDYTGSDDVLDVLTEVARADLTQYSYKNALVAIVDGKPAGAIVGYDGCDLPTLRSGSLKIIQKYHPGIEVNDDETGPGEFYIDSVAVLPEFRGRGIGHRLIEAMMQKQSANGFNRFGLLVHYANPDAERLYLSMGFLPAGERPFFGHMMKHLLKSDLQKFR